MKLVLLHSPLVGPGSWDALAPVLRQRGHDVVVPDLSAIMQGSPPYYSKLAILAASAAQDSILVVHSGAGALVPAIAEQASIQGSIFVDALLPHPGKCWFDTAQPALNARVRSLARDGVLPPWHRWWPNGAIEMLLGERYDAFAADLNSLPLAYFEEVALDIGLATTSAYLQIGEMNAAETDWAQAQGWPVARLKLHHLAMLTDPDAVAAAILNLAARL